MNLIIYFIITKTHFFQNHYQTFIKKKKKKEREREREREKKKKK